MGKKKKKHEQPGVKLVKLNWDKECKNDMLFGRGFEITEPAIRDKDQKSMNGIQSPRFSTDWSDDDAFSERFRCVCGETKGKVFEHEICPHCNTEVKFTDVDLSITGWIILRNNCIIQPIYYNKLKAIIGKTEFPDIINYNKRINKDGEVEAKESSKNPFYGIGLVEFRERFDEILAYYKKKKKNSSELIAEIEEDKDNIFASCIPVYSSVLRPISFRSDSFFYTTIDRKFNSIFASSRLLNDAEYFEERRKKWKKEKRERMDVPTILSSIQNKLMELWDLVFESIDQKDG